MTVGDRIKQKRIELGLSQDELATKMGYSSKSAVSRTENSGDDVGRKRVVAFAKALGCEPSELMGWSETVFDIKTVSQAVAKSVMRSNGMTEEEINDFYFNEKAREFYSKYLMADKKTRKMIDMLLEEGD